MTSADFRRWRKSMGVTQPGAAEMLDITTRTIARYEGGEGPIPRTVAYACAWLLECHAMESANGNVSAERESGLREANPDIWRIP